MSIALAVAALALLAGLALVLQHRSVDPPQDATTSVFHDLRNQFLAVRPADLGIPSPLPNTHNGVFGAAMEIAFPEGVATVVALGDGTASLYLESGGGVIGTGRHERVHRAALALIETADRLAFAGDPDDAPPLPDAGEVRFHWLTEAGPHSSCVSGGSLESGEHALAELHRAGHELLATMREVEEPAAT